MNLLLHLQNHYPVLFTELGFEPKTDEQEKPYYVKLISREFILSFILEQGVILVGVSPLSEPNRIFDLSSVIALLTTLDGLSVTLDQEIRFVRDYYSQIAELFSTENIEHTRTECARIHKEFVHRRLQGPTKTPWWKTFFCI